MIKTTHTDQMRFSSIGIDICKDVLHHVGFDHSGQIVLRRKIKRLALITTFETLAPCIVGMEACLSAHFVSRTLRKLGFEPRIIPVKYTKPFIKGQKNDYMMPKPLRKHRCFPISIWWPRRRKHN